MIPVIAIVGKSNIGKTTFIEKLLPEIISRGYRVATIKHDVHGFEVDKEGKDSWRHRKAGAACTVISSPKQLALIRDIDHDAMPDEVLGRFISDVDLVITEGYKREPLPKVEVYRSSMYPEPLCTKDDNLIAVMSDKPLDLGAPCLGLDDVKELTDIIEQRFLAPRQMDTLRLVVDGELVPLKPFIDTLLKNAIKGMTASLKGCANPHEIEISIR